MKPGTGRRQQLILRLLADGTPRNCATIAAAINAPAPRVHEVIAIMLTRHWVREIGRGRNFMTQVWTITDEGRQQIPDEYSKP
ncbi:hypothetical protein [Nocardia wallacei]|uniref:hypothetical protein n=1 Tax=Nocardia wallacei TaxID=480035 RepID=UPI0024583BCA|nr:hypothetical protein [Nocardia wallacei]